MVPTSGWKQFGSSGAKSWSSPLDGLRKALTKGLEVRVEQPEARRGHEVRALVVVTEPDRLGQLEVGLVCAEYYDEEVRDHDMDGHSNTRRTTSRAFEYEQWQPLQSVQGEQEVTFTVPAQAPYSYDGDCLSFRWEVVARGRKSGLDAQAGQEIAVRA